MASFKEVLQASTPVVPMQEENKKRYLSAHVFENVDNGNVRNETNLN